MTTQPHTIRMNERDNVAIVANDGGLQAGTVLPGGLQLADRVPQGHKVALVAIAAGAPVLRYGIPIGHALKDIPAGAWVHEKLLQMPDARGLEGLPIATVKREPLPPLEGYSFEGYRNADGSVGTRNILAITHHRAVCGRRAPTSRSSASRPSCCRSTRTWTTWSRWSMATAAAWPSTRPTP